MKKVLFFLLSMASITSGAQTITLTVDAAQKLSAVSPWIYGRNNNVSDNPGASASAALWQLYQDAGLRMYRENGGNNSTKYNWRAKLTSHPDWFNNVYAHDWDYAAASLLSNTSNTQALMAFQLLGKVASNTNYNFNDYAYTQANGYVNTDKNWAGGGGPVAYGGNGGNGNSGLYLKDWTADSTVAILDHWFNDLDLDASRLQYWNMDNEPDIWNYTHDDVTTTMTAEEYIQKYIAVAKAARTKFPSIKLVGPVTANEWFWYTWNNTRIQDPVNPSVYYSFTEYFIKRIAEEQQASGLKLLDVYDVHFYAGTEGDIPTTLQLHRIWYDINYNYPKANGVKVLGAGGWDNNIKKEYYFRRCNQWLNQYMGANHGVHMSVSEIGSIDQSNANVVACWYASHLGIFAENGVEIFTPWSWYTGQWEVMHLFSRYFGTQTVKTTSTLDSLVSGYSALSLHNDSLTIVVVNRDVSASRNVIVNLDHFIGDGTTMKGYQLAGLPSSETFLSHSNNALQGKSYTLNAGSISMSVPALSVTLIQIPAASVSTGILSSNSAGPQIRLFPNPAKHTLTIESGNNTIAHVIIADILGRTMASYSITGSGDIDVSELPKGQYIVQVEQDGTVRTQKFVKE